MATLTRDAVTITPELVLGWQQGRAGRSVVHQILSRPDPDVTLRPSAVATGTLSLFFTSLTDAQQALTEHADTPGVWTFDGSPEEPALTLTYVLSPDGTASMRADGTQLTRWVVEVPYQVVQP